MRSYTAKINLNNDTTYSSWTPSNTAGNITNAVPNAIHEALPDDYKEYVYFVKIYQTTSIIIKENATLDKIPKTWTLGIVMELFYKPNTPSDWSAGTLNTLDNQGFSVKELGYYNNGTLQSVTNGFYGPMYADNFNANVSQENGVYYFIVNMPAVRARCNDNYFATTQASNIEDADFEITIEVYKTPRNNSPVGDLLNDMIADYPVIPA